MRQPTPTHARSARPATRGAPPAAASPPAGPPGRCAAAPRCTCTRTGARWQMLRPRSSSACPASHWPAPRRMLNYYITSRVASTRPLWPTNSHWRDELEATKSNNTCGMNQRIKSIAIGRTCSAPGRAIPPGRAAAEPPTSARSCRKGAWVSAQRPSNENARQPRASSSSSSSRCSSTLGSSNAQPAGATAEAAGNGMAPDPDTSLTCKLPHEQQDCQHTAGQ